MTKQTYKTAIEKACELMGGQSELAEKLEISVQAVNKWVKKGKPPAERVLEIEDAVGRKVTRYELRPDIYGKAVIAKPQEARP